MDGPAPAAPLDAVGVSRRKRIAEIELPTSPTSGGPTSTTPTSGASSGEGTHTPSRKRHHHINSMPKHLAFNVHVHNGYRQYPLSPVQAVTSVLEWHNETANIWTHLAPGLLCIYWVVAFLFSMQEGVHYAAIPVAHACSAVCFLGSALYHTFMVATDEQSYRKLLMFDLFGIWVVNVGAAIISAQLQLPCQPVAVKLGVAFGPSIAAALWIMFVAKTPATRALSFALQLAFRVGVLIVSYNTGATLWTPGWLATHLAFEAWPFIGAAINIFRWPDKWYPGVFDFFQSHTIMHICVAVGMLAQDYLGHSRAGHIDADPRLSQCIADHGMPLSLW